MLTIVAISKENIVNTIMENLAKGGIITEQEKTKFRGGIEALSDCDLLIALIESHEQKEKIIAQKN